jgi:hypothetical protein
MLISQKIIGIIASVFCFLYFVPYIISILKGKTRPNRASWWIWVTLGVFLCIFYDNSEPGTTLWALAAPVIGQLIIAILSLKYGEGGWSRFDRFCLAGAGISLILRWQSNSDFAAMIFLIAIDILAALPTIKKSYLEPETEDLLTWSLYSIGSLLNLFTINIWSIEKATWPLYVFFVNTIIVVFLLLPQIRTGRLFRRRYVRKTTRASKR